MASSQVRLVVSGCCGRMGSLIVEEAAKEKNLSLLQVVGGVEGTGHPQIGQNLPVIGSAKITSDLNELIHVANLIIEFTTPAATLNHAKTAAKAGIPLLIGTTGFTPEQFDQLQTLSRQIPIFWSPNMSLGIVVVRRTIGSISQQILNFGLSDKTKVHISETHHTQKKDAPSGTAKTLRDELLKQTGWLIRDEEIEARREGEIIGIHSVVFDLGSEKITLTHEATDRRVFAQGALVVARHLRELWAGPGFYGMDNFVSAIQNLHAKT